MRRDERLEPFLLFRVLHRLFVDRCIDRTWCDGVHANLVRCVFKRDRFCEHLDATLTRRIVRITWAGDDFMHRRHVDDISLNLVFDEIFQRGTHTEERARQVRIDNLLPIVELHLVRLRFDLDTGVVDEDIHLPKLRDSFLDHLLGEPFFRDVPFYRDRFPATRLDATNNFVHLVFATPIVQDDMDAFFRIALGDGTPNPFRTPRDDRDFPF